MHTIQLEVSWHRILDKIRVLWAKYALPRYTGHPDLPGKMASPEDPGKSGSDCIIKRVCVCVCVALGYSVPNSAARQNGVATCHKVCGQYGVYI